MTGVPQQSATTARQVERFRVSPLQRHLWELDGLNSRTPYRTNSRVTFHGPLEPDSLRRGLDAVAARHDIVRATFTHSQEGDLLQSADGAPPLLQVHDLSGLSRQQRAAAVRVIEADIAARHVDFARGPLLAAALVRLAADDHILILDLPALASDGCGMLNLVSELCRAYDSVQDTQAATSDDVLQYADASIWMNDSLEGPETLIARDYWGRSDFSAVAGRLPSSIGSTLDASFSPQSTSAWTLSRDLVDAIAAQPGAPDSPETFLLTCWRALLDRHAGGDSSVLVTCGFEGREFEELQSAVGLFARALPIRDAIPGLTPFGEALAQTRTLLAEARQWGESFDWNLAGGVAQLPPQLRFASFAYEHRNWADRFTTASGLVCLLETRTCVDRFDLKLVSAESAGVVRCWIEYDASRYSDRDVQQLSQELHVLVDDAARHPETSLVDLCLLSEGEQHDIVEQLNRDAGRAAVAACVHTTFEARVSARADQPAVVCDDQVLTYGELNARANRLARYLQHQGVGPDTRVGLCLERSTDLIVSILATLKAGGAYVPLDPHLPAGRLVTILDESHALIILTRAAFREMLPPSAPVVMLEAKAEAIASESDENLASTATPEHLAYVLFTSGSTGRPKGVAVEHRQLVSYTRAVSERVALPDDATCATVTTLASDLGNTAIFPALLAGGCLHVITEHRASNPQAFAEYFSRHRIDLLKIVPSHLRALLSVTDPGRVLPRKRLVLGGEASSWDLVDTVRQLAPECVIFNHYGPTETTVGATVFQVSDDEERLPSLTVPIGRPLSHAKAYVVDRKQRPVPAWIAGELLIGGEGVARGYLHAPDLTNERFIPDPFTPSAHARMYRTGDLVRLLPTGDIVFLGRIDDQVKIRGYRVEPGEIASVIRRHPDVRDATVLVRDADKQLAAFVVSRGAPARSAELTAYLKQELPEYMIPASIVMLDALPLTPNGKIDRAALLAMWAATPTSSASSPSAGRPSSAWELVIADVWRELLAIEEIAVHDNFYDLGGHSLLAIQVVAALEKRTGLGVSPRDLAFHTLKQFAARCESRMPLAPTSPSTH